MSTRDELILERTRARVERFAERARAVGFHGIALAEGKYLLVERGETVWNYEELATFKGAAWADMVVAAWYVGQAPDLEQQIDASALFESNT